DNMRPSGFFPVPSAVVFGTKHTRFIEEMDEKYPYGFPATKKSLSGLRVPNDWRATEKGLTVSEEANVEKAKGSGNRSAYNDIVVNSATIFPKMLFYVEEKNHSASKLGRV